jgi:hypothetical protein
VPKQSTEVSKNETVVVEDGDASTQGELRVYARRKQNKETRLVVTLVPTSSVSRPTRLAKHLAQIQITQVI